MGDQQNISQILAALAAVRPGGLTGLPPGSIANTTSAAAPTGYSLPQPDSTGSLNISGANPVNAGSVSIADAIAKARGIAAEKGISYNPSQGQTRDMDTRLDSRSYRRSRSPSRTPPRPSREVFRDGYNPYRDERRSDRRGGGDRGYGRERSFSPHPSGRGGDPYSPPPTRQYRGPEDRSPPARRGGGAEDNSDTINIDSKLVGLIIGRQGENLRRIEADTGARVQFLDSPDYNKAIRVCRISGSKVAQNDAKTEINRIISENEASSRPGFRQAERPSHVGHDGATAQPKFGEGESSMQIMVPDRTVGLIIGRSGETIRDLQERSGCHVNIENDGKSISGLRPVNLTGTAQSMQLAKELMMEIVDSDARQSGNQQQREPRGQSSAGDVPSGSVDKINYTIFIPKEAVGMIIGKGGDTIKEMQSATGCKINILPPVGREPEREVTLLGSQAAIEEAERNIMEKVDAVKNRAPAPRRDDNYERYPQYQQQPQQPQQPQQHQQHQHQPYSQDTNTSSQQSPAQASGADGADPYAMYGGYDNYVAMWYAAMAQQQQQQQQQQYQPPSGLGAPPSSEQPGPPGVS